MQPTMRILVGPIASGKSTYARYLGALTVNDDALLIAVHAGLYEWHPEHKPLYVALENAIVQHAAALKVDVTIDRGGRTKAQRSRFVSLGKSLGFQVTAVVFPRQIPFVHAQRRFNVDPRGYSFERWLEVARRHEKEYQEVTADEGFDTITTG